MLIPAAKSRKLPACDHALNFVSKEIRGRPDGLRKFLALQKNALRTEFSDASIGASTSVQKSQFLAKTFANSLGSVGKVPEHGFQMDVLGFVADGVVFSLRSLSNAHFIACLQPYLRYLDPKNTLLLLKIVNGKVKDMPTKISKQQAKKVPSFKSSNHRSIQSARQGLFFLAREKAACRLRTKGCHKGRHHATSEAVPVIIAAH